MNRKQLFYSLLVIIFGALAGLQVFAESAPQLIELSEARKKNIPCVEYAMKDGKQYCTTGKMESPKKQVSVYNEKLNLAFDNRNWVAAWGKSELGSITVEYIVQGDNIDNWNELITSQFFPGLQQRATPKVLADFSIKTMKQNGIEPLVTFHSNQPNEVIFEFQVKSPSSAIQNEIQRIFSTKSGLYAVHYVIKKQDMGAVERQKWIALLKKAMPK